MTPDDFRRLALALPEVVEQSHMGHPDFRVGGKVFASLGYPDGGWGMVNLPTEEQEVRVQAEPEIFRPAAGAWGRRGSTTVRLEAADEEAVRGALAAAWRKTAPKRAAPASGS